MHVGQNLSSCACHVEAAHSDSKMPAQEDQQLS